MNESQFLGISEDRLKHIIGVSRKAYKIAKEMDCDEEFARKCFMLGWLHDVGYEFSEVQSDHARISSEMLRQLLCAEEKSNTTIPTRTNDAILYHGQIPYYDIKNNLSWKILNMADMLIDPKGNEVTIQQRLNDIKDRYGEKSSQYIDACRLCFEIGLTDTNLANN